MTKLENYNNTIFESIKHTDENGYEYWYARELMFILEYGKWQNFEKLIIRQRTLAKTVIFLYLNILLTSVSCQNVQIMQKLKLKIMN